MRVQVLVIRDSASRSFGIPQFATAIGVFQRDIGDMVNGDPKHPFAMHPEDYEVFKIGEYDDATGEFHGIKMESVVRLKDLVVPKH